MFFGSNSRTRQMLGLPWLLLCRSAPCYGSLCRAPPGFLLQRLCCRLCSSGPLGIVCGGRFPLGVFLLVATVLVRLRKLRGGTCCKGRPALARCSFWFSPRPYFCIGLFLTCFELFGLISLFSAVAVSIFFSSTNSTNALLYLFSQTSHLAQRNKSFRTSKRVIKSD